MNALFRHASDFAAPRMNSLSRLPLFFALGGKRAVVEGNNAAAAWKAELLAAAGARVDVYSATPCKALLDLASDAVTIFSRVWTANDLAGAVLAVSAAEDDETAGTFAAAARAAGVPVNVIDKPKFCDFSFGAIVNRSPLVVGISTDGAAPVFAQAIRTRLEVLLPQGFSRWAAAAARWRGAVKASGLSFAGRRKFWRLFAARAMTTPDSEPRSGDFQNLIEQAECLERTRESGSMARVDVVASDPELLTLRAVRKLQSADVIVFDDRVPRGILDFARREAKTIVISGCGSKPASEEHGVNDLAIKFVRDGKHVVRLTVSDGR
jgi:uroporphyrin-III C-methyltransferase/precorrin-2 dehydrogenase/sirohydrochlorin ferrochelatase